MAKPTKEEVEQLVRAELGPNVECLVELPTGILTPDVEIQLGGSHLGELDQGKIKRRITKKVAGMTGSWKKLQVIVRIEDPQPKERERKQMEDKEVVSRFLDARLPSGVEYGFSSDGMVSDYTGMFLVVLYGGDVSDFTLDQLAGGTGKRHAHALAHSDRQLAAASRV